MRISSGSTTGRRTQLGDRRTLRHRRQLGGDQPVADGSLGDGAGAAGGSLQAEDAYRTRASSRCSHRAGPPRRSARGTFDAVRHRLQGADRACHTPIDLSVPNLCGVIMGGPGRMNLRGVTMEVIAAQLSARVGRTVVDRTDLPAASISTSSSRRHHHLGNNADLAAIDRPADTAASIYTAIQEQLGLKLDRRSGRSTLRSSTASNT